MIQTVFLDVDNTLLDFNENARLSMEKSFQDTGLTFRPEMFPTFISVNDRLWLEIEKGTLTRERLHEIRWEIVFSELSIDYDGKAFEKIFLHHIATSPKTIDGAMDLLRYLYPKYTVCLASNAPVEQQTKRLSHTDIPAFVHHTFISEDLGYAKPEKGFFDACFARLSDANAETSIIIGDSLSADIRGGVTSGIKTCWYNPEHKPAPADMKIDYIVHTLSEIKNIL